MVPNSHLKCWHLVGLNIKAWISSLIERPVVWLLLNNKLSIYRSFNKQVIAQNLTLTIKRSSISRMKCSSFQYSQQCLSSPVCPRWWGSAVSFCGTQGASHSSWWDLLNCQTLKCPAPQSDPPAAHGSALSFLRPYKETMIIRISILLNSRLIGKNLQL